MTVPELGNCGRAAAIDIDGQPCDSARPLIHVLRTPGNTQFAFRQLRVGDGSLLMGSDRTALAVSFLCTLAPPDSSQSGGRSLRIRWQGTTETKTLRLLPD